MMQVQTAIHIACHEFPRNFSNQEKQYILSNQPCREDLLFWFESTASDWCWTDENRRFMESLYSYTEPLAISNAAETGGNDLTDVNPAILF